MVLPFLNLRQIEYFFACDGENIALSLREDKFAQNTEIYEKVSTFEQRYFILDIHELQMQLNAMMNQQ